MDQEGSILWAKSFGGSGHDACNSIAIDENGYIYTTGEFQISVDFDPGFNDFIITSNGL